jgi:hypothetical protein
VLSELSRRRLDFDATDTASVVLGDGQTWYLPKPVLRLKPIFRGGKVVESQVVTTDPQFNVLRQAVSDAGDTVAFNVIAELAAYLLSKNYNLSDDDLSEILAYDTATEAGAGWPTAVMDVAWGRNAPKASSGGPG